MKKVFTLIAFTFILAIKSFSQCTLSPGACTPATETFDASANGFTGDFSFTSTGGNGRLISTPFSSGTIKRLKTPTLFLAANATTLSVTFTIGGNATVSGFTLSAQTSTAPGAPLTTLCSYNTPLVSGTTYCFTTTNVSSIVEKRFILVFDFTITGSGGQTITFDNFGTNAAGDQIPLPVKFANVKAFKKPSGIEISFSNLTESDVVNYSIERSAKGQQYSSIKELAPTKNDGSSADYSFTDAQPLSGNNLYRIKSVETNGKISYSGVARVDLDAKGLALTIAPNPAKATELGLQITNLPAGNYKIRIFNNNAQVVGEQLLKHSGGSFSQILPLNKLQGGMYYLELNGAVKMQKQFIVQ
ncbi:MAG: T9SS type A sorting domain-containing protein [Bacteroidota bacterium]|nr:T9SS type A sorting domain-containing protein [Bacteroidota bacterium]